MISYIVARLLLGRKTFWRDHVREVRVTMLTVGVLVNDAKQGNLFECLVGFRRQKAVTINDRARLRNPETRFIPEQLASSSYQDKNLSTQQFS